MASEQTSKQNRPEIYLGPLFVSTLVMAIAVAAAIVLLTHMATGALQRPILDIWGISIMGFVGYLGTILNLLRLKRALENVGTGIA
jgi:hypothetical protein